MNVLRLIGLRMADEASETAGGGIRNWLGALGFISALIGAEMLREDHPVWIGATLIVAALPIYLSPVIWRRLRRSKTPAAASLEYLRNKDSELGSSIRDMVWRSAWAKWFAAQSLAINNHSNEEQIMLVATSLIREALMDGRLEARGRKPGQLEADPKIS